MLRGVMKVLLMICLLASMVGAQMGERATLESVGRKPWTGGNGCNMFDTKRTNACCTDHDRRYKEGGNFGDKAKADGKLFKCVWKRNKFVAPIMFVGAFVGGSFVFQYGEKVEIQP